MKHLPRRLACAAIQRYQDHGGGLRYFGVACNFTPTCSEYTKLAIDDLGLWRGTLLGWSRIRRCQHKGLTTKIEDPYPPCTASDNLAPRRMAGNE